MSKRPVLLFACTGVDTSAWLTALRTELTDVDIRVWPDSGPVDEVDFAFVWKYPPGLLASFPKLRAIFSLGAGVESILADSALPENVPLVRMVDPGLAIGMNEFVLMRVLHYHREMPAHESSQQQQRWHRTVAPLPEDRRVGLLGLGELGGACARTLVGLGFDVAGWTRNPRALPGMQTFAGREQLEAFLARTQILVCLLPLTPDTANIIDRRTLDALPRGAVPDQRGTWPACRRR